MTPFKFQLEQFETDRVIGRIGGTPPGPSMVFTAALHGNEPAGVVALQHVFQTLREQETEIHGEVIGIVGNLAALGEGRRFIWRDLNRIWVRKYVDAARKPNEDPFGERVELNELREVLKLIDPILEGQQEKYFIDLHTTSSDSRPFIAINDQLANRRFVSDFPMPIVLGIEEYLTGPLLSYLNEYGHVAFAFEAGRHESSDSLDAHIDFIWMALVKGGIINESDVPEYDTHERRLIKLSAGPKGFFEVLFRRKVKPGEGFEMTPGFKNFEAIKKEQALGQTSDGVLTSPLSGKIFMPLYQPEGEDGFFVVRRIPRWAMGLSILLRNINFDRMLAWLPGISMDPNQPETLVVNKRIARFFTREIFHLLGYRRKKEKAGFMLFSRREIVSE